MLAGRTRPDLRNWWPVIRKTPSGLGGPARSPLLSRGHEPLHFFDPVLHDNHRRGFCPLVRIGGLLEHQESLPVRRHVIGAGSFEQTKPIVVRLCEHPRGDTDPQRLVRAYRRALQDAIQPDVKEFAAV